MAKRDFLVDIDLNRNQLLNFKLQNLATDPTSVNSAGDTGFTFWNTTLNAPRFWTGTSWISLETASNHTGDISSTGNTNTVINPNVVTNTKLADMAVNTIKGRVTTGTGDPEDLTASQVRTMLNVSDGANVTNSTTVNAAGAVMESDYSAGSILVANSVNTPIALTIPLNSVVGKIGGNFQAITIDSDLATVSGTDDTIASAKAVKAYTDGQITAHKHYQLYKPDGTTPFVYTDNSGKLHIDGDIVQSGTTYITHTENVNTTKDIITLRSGAIAGLGVGEYTGIVAKKYDGENDGRLVFDNNGIARVGDVGFEQPLATRIETPVNGQFGYWEDANDRINFKSLVTNDISNLSSWTGSTGITTLGLINSGTWNGGIITGQYGGTGVNNNGKTITLGGNLTTAGAFTTTLTATANTNVTLPTSGILTTKYATDITGNASTTSFIITHNLNTTDIVSFIKDVVTKAKVEVEEIVTNVNILTINFNIAPASGKVYRVTVIG